jgi:hypothetical protein
VLSESANSAKSLIAHRIQSYSFLPDFGEQFAGCGRNPLHENGKKKAGALDVRRDRLFVYVSGKERTAELPIITTCSSIQERKLIRCPL